MDKNTISEDVYFILNDVFNMLHHIEISNVSYMGKCGYNLFQNADVTHHITSLKSQLKTYFNSYEKINLDELIESDYIHKFRGNVDTDAYEFIELFYGYLKHLNNVLVDNYSDRNSIKPIIKSIGELQSLCIKRLKEITESKDSVMIFEHVFDFMKNTLMMDLPNLLNVDSDVTNTIKAKIETHYPSIESFKIAMDLYLHNLKEMDDFNQVKTQLSEKEQEIIGYFNAHIST